MTCARAARRRERQSSSAVWIARFTQTTTNSSSCFDTHTHAHSHTRNGMNQHAHVCVCRPARSRAICGSCLLECASASRSIERGPTDRTSSPILSPRAPLEAHAAASLVFCMDERAAARARACAVVAAARPARLSDTLSRSSTQQQLDDSDSPRVLDTNDDREDDASSRTHTHLDTWPRDALKRTTTSPPSSSAEPAPKSAEADTSQPLTQTHRHTWSLPRSCAHSSSRSTSHTRSAACTTHDLQPAHKHTATDSHLQHD